MSPPSCPRISEDGDAQSEPPSKRRKLDYAKVVVVVVGPELQCFYVPIDVLCETSTFFRTALKKNWKEASEKKVSLPEIEPARFNTYVHWVLTKELLTLPEDQRCRVEYLQLGELWILGDVLADVCFRNRILQEVHTLSHQHSVSPGHSSIGVVWQHTPVNSGTRRLYLDLSVEWSHTRFEEFRSKLNPTFVMELCSLLLQYQDKRSIRLRLVEKCHVDYHEKPDSS